MALTGLAFVVSPGTGTSKLNDAFEVNGLTITDSVALTQGTRMYSELADLSGKDYSVNQLMYFALTITVYNPTKTLKHTSAVGNEYVILTSSDTCDLSINTATDVVLTHPYSGDSQYLNLVTTENGVVKANATDALTYDKEANELKFVLKAWKRKPSFRSCIR